MPHGDYARIKALVLAARALPAAARAEYLAEACGDDLALRAEVDTLLAHDPVSPSILATGAAARHLTPTAVAGLAGATALPLPASIGPYTLQSVLGEGGMGTVYRAEQTTPIRREVALKLIRRGLDTDRIVARFAAERQALALMDHPAIAKVLDAGASPDGRPYVVMELVEGVPITRFCDEQRLTTRQRLELFLAVCHGVQHAHQKGILHRDLKPSNLLVREQDGVPAPKIIDFGVAKALGDPHEATLLTQIGHLVGTPEYMSLEQAGAIEAVVDTRTDVYSLGIVLYELLTGCRPYSFATHTPMEILRVLVETRPVKPSTAVASISTSDPPDPGAAFTPAAQRSTTEDRLRRQLAGDLDNIVLKTLAKDPAHRYSSVEQFADDIQRHLDGLPVRARPATRTYRAHKFVGRHRIGVGFAAAILLLLASAAAALTQLAVRLATERDRAVAAEQRARTEAATSLRVSQFLVDLFQVSDPNEARGNTITAREILDRGAGRIQTQLADQPEVQATLLKTIGIVYGEMGLYESATALLESALAVRTRHVGARSPEVADILRELAFFVGERGQSQKAEGYARQALELNQSLLGNTHEETIRCLGTLAGTLLDQARFAEAEPLQREVVEQSERRFGPDDPRVGRGLTNLAITLAEIGQFRDAEKLCRRALAIERRARGDAHPDVGLKFNNLAWAVEALGDYAEAEQLYRQALAVHRKVYPGDDHPRISFTLNNLANVLQARQKDSEAIPLFRLALAIRRKHFGARHALVAVTMRDMAGSLSRTGQSREAESLYTESLVILRTQAPAGQTELATSLEKYGVHLMERSNLHRSEPLLREAMDIRRQILPAGHPFTASVMIEVARLLARRKRFEEAEALLLDAHPQLVSRLGPAHPKTRHAVEQLIDLYQVSGRPEMAAKYR